MKPILFKWLLVATLITGAVSAANAQFIVKVRPTAPVVVRTHAPSPGHTWVEGEWVWRAGRYEYVNGYWIAPPRPGAVWVKGYWVHTRRGWMWRAGHWRRR